MTATTPATVTATTTSQKSMSAEAWGLLFLLGLLWGGSFFFARVAVQQIPPMTLVLARVALAAIALHVYLRGRFDVYGVLRRRWAEFLVLGLVNNAIPFTLIFAGETVIGAGLASILNATTPLWTVAIAHVATADERLSARKIAGCAIGLAGTALLVGPKGMTGLSAPLWAQLAVLGAAVSYGIAAIYGRRFSGTPAPVTAAGQLTASTLLMLPASLIVDRPWTLGAPTLDAAAMVLALAWISTAFAYILYFRIIQIAGATNASLVTLLVPPSAILLGALFLGERFGFAEIAATALIGVGLACIDGRLAGLVRRRSVSAAR